MKNWNYEIYIKWKNKMKIIYEIKREYNEIKK